MKLKRMCLTLITLSLMILTSCSISTLPTTTSETTSETFSETKETKSETSEVDAEPLQTTYTNPYALSLCNYDYVDLKEDNRTINISDYHYTTGEEYREPIGEDVFESDLWKFEFPSGTDEGGCLCSKVTSNLQNKYVCKEGDWVKLSLDEEDHGKTSGGSGVRTEFKTNSSMKRYYMEDQTSLEYKFKLDSTNLYNTIMCIGQIHILNEKGRAAHPVMMLQSRNGKLTLMVQYFGYSSDGLVDTMNENEDWTQTSYFPLGYIQNDQEMKVKFQITNRVIKIFLDDKEVLTTNFKENQEDIGGMMWKFGIYYNYAAWAKDKSYTFTNMYIKDVVVC